MDREAHHPDYQATLIELDVLLHVSKYTLPLPFKQQTSFSYRQELKSKTCLYQFPFFYFYFFENISGKYVILASC